MHACPKISSKIIITIFTQLVKLQNYSWNSINLKRMFCQVFPVFKTHVTRSHTLNKDQFRDLWNKLFQKNAQIQEIDKAMKVLDNSKGKCAVFAVYYQKLNFYRWQNFICRIIGVVELVEGLKNCFYSLSINNVFRTILQKLLFFKQ